MIYENILTEKIINMETTKGVKNKLSDLIIEIIIDINDVKIKKAQTNRINGNSKNILKT